MKDAKIEIIKKKNHINIDSHFHQTIDPARQPAEKLPTQCSASRILTQISPNPKHSLHVTEAHINSNHRRNTARRSKDESKRKLRPRKDPKVLCCKWICDLNGMAKWQEKNETGSSNSMAGEKLGGVWRNTKFGRLSGHPQAVTGASLRRCGRGHGHGGKVRPPTP